MTDAITVMEHAGMTRQVPVPPFPQPHSYGASGEEYDAWLDATDRVEPIQASPELATYLDARDHYLAANCDAQVIPRHKLWTNDGWLISLDELDAALPHAQRPRWTAASGPSPGGPSGSTTSTPPAATAASGFISNRPAAPLAPTPTDIPIQGEPMSQDSNHPRYPDICVQLSGEDGNAFAILGRTTRALRQASLNQDEIGQYYTEATSGDYDHLLHTTTRWVSWE